jgi:hypothetical protein
MPNLAEISAAETRLELSAKYTYWETITGGPYPRRHLRRCRVLAVLPCCTRSKKAVSD